MTEHCNTCRFFEANRFNADAPGRCKHNAPQAAEPTWPTTTPDDWCGQYKRAAVQQPAPQPTLVEQAAKVHYDAFPGHAKYDSTTTSHQRELTDCMLQTLEFLRDKAGHEDSDVGNLACRWLSQQIAEHRTQHEDAP